MKPQVQTQKQLRKKYPLSYLPIQIRVQSVVRPVNQLPLGEWLEKYNSN